MDRPPASFPLLTPLTRELLRERSKVLFGNQDRLEVSVAIANSYDGVVNATDLAVEIDLAVVRVRLQLLALLDAGLLIAVPGPSHKRWYVRQDSPFWEACRNLMQTWIREVEQQVGDSVRR